MRYYITSAASSVAADGAVVLEPAVATAATRYNGMVGTVMTIVRQEGPKYVFDPVVYNGDLSTPWRVTDR